MRLRFLMGVWICILPAPTLAALQNSPLPQRQPVQPNELLSQGFALHQQSRFTEAIPYFARVLKAAPSDYFANLLMGIDLLRIGNTTAAIPYLELAARLHPAEELADGYLGEAESNLGHFARAATAYQQALLRARARQQPQDALIAWASFALERFRVLNQQLRTTAAGTIAVEQLKQTAGKAACNGSIQALERALAAHQEAGDEVKTASQLARCYAIEAGHAAELLGKNPGDEAVLHRLRGDVLLRLSEDASGAVNEYKAALALRAGDPALLERLAEAEFSAGDTEAAERDARSALQVDAHRRGALRTLASLQMNERNYAEAVPTLRTLVAEEPGNAMLRVELGVALGQTGNPEEAVGILAPALQAGYPDEKGAFHAVLARALRRLGRTADADKADAEARRLSDRYQRQGNHQSQ